MSVTLCRTHWGACISLRHLWRGSVALPSTVTTICMDSYPANWHQGFIFEFIFVSGFISSHLQGPSRRLLWRSTHRPGLSLTGKVSSPPKIYGQLKDSTHRFWAKYQIPGFSWQLHMSPPHMWYGLCTECEPCRIVTEFIDIQQCQALSVLPRSSEAWIVGVNLRGTNKLPCVRS